MDTLPPHALVDVIARVPLAPAGASDFRRLQAPLVCKSWAALMREPAWWRTTVLDLRGQASLDRERAQAWLRARAGGIQRLALLLPAAHADFAASALAALAEAPGLQLLCVDYGEAEDSEGLLEKLVPLLPDGLQVLCFSGLKGLVEMPDLEDLPELRALHLHFRGPGEHELLNFPFCLDGCYELEELVVAGADYSLSDNEDGPELPALRRVSFLDRASAFEIPPAGFEDADALEELQLLTPGIEYMSTRLPDLCDVRALTHLEMHFCTFPFLLAGLPALKHLTLWELWTPPTRGTNGNPRLDPNRLDDAQRDKSFRGLLHGAYQQFRLESLALRNCCQRYLPPAVQQLTSLRSLTISGCPVNELPPGPYLQHMEHLDLSDSCFSRVPPAALASPRLRTLAMLEGQPPLALPEVGLRGEAGFCRRVAEVDARLTARWRRVKRRHGNPVTGAAAAAAFVAARRTASAAPVQLRQWAQAGADAVHGLAPALQPGFEIEPFIARVFLPLLHLPAGAADW